MTTLVALRIPSPLLAEITKIEEQEDKTKTHVILQLLEEAITLRKYKRGESIDKAAERMDELKEKCTTEILLKMAAYIGEIYRYTYKSELSKYKDCQTQEELQHVIESNVENYIKGFLAQ